jgi:SAM-dependent methyltransferase
VSGTSPDVDYILGTHDEEVARLGLQHRLWRPRAMDAWRRAGFRAGQRLADIGSGPGFAALDLAEVVGPSGHVFAIERSRRFLDVLEREREQRALSQLSTRLADLDLDALPADLDGAWCRWVLAFVKRPRTVVEKIAVSLKPGGVFVAHEYLNYAAWRLLPASPAFESFVAEVIASWRADGGEPDIAIPLPGWLERAGFEIRSLRPIIDLLTPADDLWAWPEAFLRVGLERLVSLGRFTPTRAQTILRDFEARKADPGIRWTTPLVLELIAVKR